MNQTFLIKLNKMEENKTQETFDPRDLNQDGKVTLGEKVQYAAGKAAEKAKEVYADAKEKTVEVAGKVADKTRRLPGKWLTRARNFTLRPRTRLLT